MRPWEGWQAVLASFLLYMSAGCVAVPAPAVTTRLHPGSRYLLHLPGVVGVTVFDQWWLQALRDAKAVD